MYYHVLNVVCKGIDLEILAALLSDFPFESFGFEENLLQAYIQSDKLNQDLKDQCVNKLKDFDCGLSWEYIEEKNWNEEWESNFQPVIVGDFCRIYARFHPPSHGFKHQILIQPEMAFGTGHHETTYMMIQAMEDIDFRRKRVLDFGCGTGILAILSEKLGAVEVHAIDNDPNSLANSKINCKLNNSSKIEILASTENITTSDDFDIILANINRNVLMSHASRLNEIAKQNAILILSGILKTDFEDIVDYFKNARFELKKQCERGNWMCLQFKKLS